MIYSNNATLHCIDNTTELRKAQLQLWYNWLWLCYDCFTIGYGGIRSDSLPLWWAKVIMMWFNRGTKRFFAVTIKFTLRYDKFVHHYKYDTTRDNYATIHSVFDGMRYNSLRLQYDSLPLRLAVTGQWHFGTIHSIYDVIRYDALQS